MSQIQEAATSAEPAKRLSPLRAPLAFRVGVVGHRPNRLGQADLGGLAGVLRTILETVKEEVLRTPVLNPLLYASGAPILRAVSPLAEGTDRLFADQALDLGFELCCVMPFPQTEFEKDFAPGKALEENSPQRFRALLERATATSRLTQFELDGERDDEGEAYSMAGRVVLNQSDLLVLVWDGVRQGKRGGTEESFDDAQRSGIPVVWIDAQAPHQWQIVDTVRPPQLRRRTLRLAPVEQASVDDLRRTVRDLLDLPNTALSEHREEAADRDDQQLLRSCLADFYTETHPAWHPWVLWNLFKSVVGDGRWPKASWRVREFEDAVKPEWEDDPSTPIGRLVECLRPYFAWSDKLAVLYADRYRSAFILAFLLAAVAVGMALLPVAGCFPAHGWAQTACVAGELVAILVVIGLVVQGRRRRWHERWIDYRLAAELVRNLRLVASLGWGRPFPRVPAHWDNYVRPNATWMAWYVRAVERGLGLPSAVVDKPYLDACLVRLSQLAKEQVAFHEINARRCHRIERRLHGIGITLLLLTLLCCAFHLLPVVSHWLPPHVLTFFCGFFPALGAAMAGIINQGEFRRIAKRSQAMVDHLEPLRDRIEALRERIPAPPNPAEPQCSVQVVTLAREVAKLLVNEVLDWRVVFLDRPLDPPA